MRNLGMVGGVSGGANETRTRTLAERLESANGIIAGQLDRAQSFLSRVNGVPPTPTTGQESPARIAATSPLSESVAVAEMLGKRLAELADGLDRIG